MTLWTPALESARVVAVMGLCKNSGKTVALNHLMAGAAQRHETVGLSSIGRDGEACDAVFAIPKPAVQVWPGTVVATARGTLARARVRLSPIASTGLPSALGEVMLVRVQERGEMEVAGPSHGEGQRAVVAALQRCGADRVFLDGALGRSPHASPALADGVVLATGAALGGGLDGVLRRTRERLALLGIAGADAAVARRCAALFAQQGVGLWTRDGQAAWRSGSASLTAAAELEAAERSLPPGSAALGTIAMTGAVGRRLWAALLALAARHSGLRVVVADGTRLFIEAADLAALAARGACVMAWRPIRVLGIAVNPFSPVGAHLDAATLQQAARRAFPGHAVVDVCRDTAMPAGMVTAHG